MLGATCQVDQQPDGLSQAAQPLVLHDGLLETQRILEEKERAEQRQVIFKSYVSLNQTLSGHHGYTVTC